MTRKWWLDKDLYRLARYYARMYPKWLDEYNAIGGDAKDGYGDGKAGRFKTSETEREAMRREEIGRKIAKIERAAMEADPQLSEWILEGVENCRKFEELKGLGMPCERDMYYDRRKKFYYILAHMI